MFTPFIAPALCPSPTKSFRVIISSSTGFLFSPQVPYEQQGLVVEIYGKILAYHENKITLLMNVSLSEDKDSSTCYLESFPRGIAMGNQIVVVGGSKVSKIMMIPKFNGRNCFLYEIHILSSFEGCNIFN